MLGRSPDPDGVEGEAGDRDRARPAGRDHAVRGGEGAAARDRRRTRSARGGYEIHHGTLEIGGGEPFPGGVRDGVVFATMWHGSLESDGFRTALLAEVAAAAGTLAGLFDRREARLDLLGDLVERHLDTDALLGLAREGAPGGLPVLPPGGGYEAPGRRSLA